MGGGKGGRKGGGGFRGTRGGYPRRQHGNTPMNNQKQNEQTNAVASKLKLTPKQREELHRLVSKQGYTYKEILELAKDWFKK